MLYYFHVMISPIEKIRRSLRFYYYGWKNGWSFPPRMTHLAGGKIAAGSYEPEVSRAVADNLDEGDLFIDAGANVGYFSRLASRIVGPEGTVYALEADYENYHALVKNIGDRPNACAIHLALSNKNAFVTLNRSSHSACHSVVKTGNELADFGYTIPTITLDHFWEIYLEKRPVSLLKIDVEGAELMVMEGMEQILKERKVSTVIVEFCPAIIRNAGFRIREFYERLAPHFTLSVIDRSYRSAAGGGHIDTPEKFRALEEELMAGQGIVNVNLLGRRRP